MDAQQHWHFFANRCVAFVRLTNGALPHRNTGSYGNRLDYGSISYDRAPILACPDHRCGASVFLSDGTGGATQMTPDDHARLVGTEYEDTDGLDATGCRWWLVAGLAGLAGWAIIGFIVWEIVT